MAMILKGAAVAAALSETLALEVADLRQKGIHPTLAIVQVGERGDDSAYARGAIRRCEQIGIATTLHSLPIDAPQATLLETIAALNQNPAVHGVLLLRPLPPQMEDSLVRNALLPEKDIDGITDASLARVFTGEGAGFPPCCAQACIELLQFYGCEIQGKRAVVVGRSLVVGKPLAMMLMDLQATVTICHSRTRNLPEVCRSAELLLIAMGRANMVDASYVAPGQAVVDVGVNVDASGALVGDVCFKQVEPIVDAITPVPGGIGAVTTAVLAKHVVQAARKAT